MTDLQTELGEALNTFAETLARGRYQGSPWFKELLSQHQEHLTRIAELATAQADRTRLLEESLAEAAMVSEQQLASLAAAVGEKEKFRDLWRESIAQPR